MPQYAGQMLAQHAIGQKTAGNHDQRQTGHTSGCLQNQKHRHRGSHGFRIAYRVDISDALQVVINIGHQKPGRPESSAYQHKIQKQPQGMFWLPFFRFSRRQVNKYQSKNRAEMDDTEHLRIHDAESGGKINLKNGQSYSQNCGCGFQCRS